MRESRDDWIPLITVCLMLLVVFALAAAYSWYGAGLQQKVYERQGIEMTRWECFIGAQPAEAVIQIKENHHAQP